MKDYDKHLEAQYGPDLDGEAVEVEDIEGDWADRDRAEWEDRMSVEDQADYDRDVIDLRDDDEPDEEGAHDHP